ncbi:UNVERIFIED_CONTAM: hypothetical protein Scaly_1011200 [Sesamum calycinum]|uniref:Uncharacterized protein n=1 Tax=Sesamum calycinum TaxID=2727403 RepID=A0AAW2QJB9_9LAMI
MKYRAFIFIALVLVCSVFAAEKSPHETKEVAQNEIKGDETKNTGTYVGYGGGTGVDAGAWYMGRAGGAWAGGGGGGGGAPAGGMGSRRYGWGVVAPQQAGVWVGVWWPQQGGYGCGGGGAPAGGGMGGGGGGAPAGGAGGGGAPGGAGGGAGGGGAGGYSGGFSHRGGVYGGGQICKWGCCSESHGYRWGSGGYYGCTCCSTAAEAKAYKETRAKLEIKN